ncbi:MAG TPA: class E sortase [Acidimicrobiales bacterium]|nr:class E sortase [Acidimicrobiales bacterium]
MDALIRFLRANPWARRGLSALSGVLLVGALGVLGYPVYTNVYRDRVQSRLDRELASPALKQAYEKKTLGVGDPLTRIEIPAIGVDTVVVEGTSASALRAGAGHYPSTPLPCEAGNVGIAGHRTTYGKPFNQLDRLKLGDVIILETPIGSCTYEVVKAPTVILPTDLSVVSNDVTSHKLTLTTCHPKGSAARRLYVQAKLTKGAGQSA